MANIKTALQQIANDEARNGITHHVRTLVSKASEASRQRGGGFFTPPEQLTSNGMLSSLKIQAKLTSSGNTLTLSPIDNGMFPLYGDASQGWVNCFLIGPVTLSTVGKTSGKLYDVFGYWDQTLDTPTGAMELVEWTDETTRSVALLTQDGVSLKSTDTSRRFISVVRYNGSTMLVPSIDPNGELFFGTGDPRNNTSDPFSGVGMSAGGVTFGSYVWQFFAAVAGVVGVGFNAAGQLLAGVGAVVLDALGISFLTQSTYSAPTAIKWYDLVGTLTAQIWAAIGSGSYEFWVQAKRIAGKDTAMYITADFETGKQGVIVVELDRDGGFRGKMDIAENWIRLQHATSILLTGPVTASSTIAATGAITGSNLSGTNTGNQVVASVIGCNMGAATVAASTTSYIGPFMSAAVASTAASNLPISSAGTIQKLHIRTNSAQPASGALVFTVFKNNAATALTVTIAAGAAGNNDLSDTTHSFAVAAGDRLTVELANAATAASAQITGISFELLPS